MAEKSTMTIANPSQYIGSFSGISIQVNAVSTGVVHDLAYKFATDADSSYTTVLTNQTASTLTWDVEDFALAQKIPNSTTGVWTLRLTTKYDGTTVGTDTANVTLIVPDDEHFKPEFTTRPTVAPYPNNPSISGNSAFAGMYVAGYSQVRASGYTAVGKSGASIVEYRMFVENEEDVSPTSGSTITTPYKLQNSGTKSVTIYAVDSRGFWSDNLYSTYSIDVYDYAPPSFYPFNYESSIRIGRCASATSTKTNDTGTYFLMRIGRRIAPLNGTNTCGIHLHITDASGNVVNDSERLGSAWQGLEFADVADNIANILTQDDHYTVTITSTDLFGGSSTLNQEIYSITPLVVISPKSRAIGIKCTPTGDRLEVDMVSYFKQALEADRFISVLSGTNGGNTIVRIAPRYNHTDVGLGSTDSFPSNAFLEAWLKKIVTAYSTVTQTTFIGNVVPVNGGFVACYIQSCSDVSGGLPNSSTGIYIPYNTATSSNRGAMVRFGTDSYTFWYNVYQPNYSESVTLSYSTNNVFTSSNFSSGFHMYHAGKVCTLNVGATPTSTAGGSGWVTVGTMPSAYKPQNTLYETVPLDTSTYNNCGIQVDTSGNIKVYKNNTSTQGFRVNLTWIIA